MQGAAVSKHGAGTAGPYQRDDMHAFSNTVVTHALFFYSGSFYTPLAHKASRRSAYKSWYFF